MKKSFYPILAGLAALAIASCQGKANVDDPSKVEKAPTADFEWTVSGFEVSFTDKSENATSYKWDFGDGEDSKEASPKHTYASAGEYTVKLTVANSEGAQAQKSATITLVGAAKAYFSATPQTDRAGHFGLQVDFDATSSENAASIAWDFGDGETADEFKTSHVYGAYGTYTVKAEVTGIGGDKDIYEASVEVIAYNELLKGGSMEEDDAQYWTVVSSEVLAPWDEGGEPMPEVLSWVPYFGYTEDGPSTGEGGCLRLSSENQIHDQANTVYVYQAIEVEEGDYLEISAKMKWGEDTNDSGLLWFGFSKDIDAIASAVPDISVVEMYNYWNSAFETPGAEAVPAFDGGFGANDGYIAKNAELGLGYSNDGEAVAHYWVQETGTLYYFVTLRSIWGSHFGPGLDYYFDDLSVKVVPAPAEEE